MKVADWVSRWQCWCRDGVLGAVARAHLCLLKEGTHVYSILGNRQQATVFFKAGQKCLEKRSRVEATRQVNLIVPNFGSWVGTCTGIVGLYKHIFHVKAHPWFLEFELWMLMGACMGQYGTDKSGLLGGVGKRGQCGSRESCIMLQNGPTQSLVTQC